MTGCALTSLARPASITSDLFLRLVAVCLRFRFRVARLAPRWCISAPPVRGVLRLVRGARKCFFEENAFFSKKPHFPRKNRGLSNQISRTLGQIGIKLPTPMRSVIRLSSTYGVIHRPIPKTHQTQWPDSGESQPIQASESPDSPIQHPDFLKIPCPTPDSHLTRDANSARFRAN